MEKKIVPLSKYHIMEAYGNVKRFIKEIDKHVYSSQSLPLSSFSSCSSSSSSPSSSSAAPAA